MIDVAVLVLQVVGLNCRSTMIQTFVSTQYYFLNIRVVMIDSLCPIIEMAFSVTCCSGPYQDYRYSLACQDFWAGEPPAGTGECHSMIQNFDFAAWLLAFVHSSEIF